MADGIPLVVVMNLVVILKHPELLKTACIRTNIANNSTQAFYGKGIQLKVLSLAPIESNCAGLFCDHQSVIETSANSKGCGYYSMETRRANIITTLDIKFAYNDGKYALSAEYFTSSKFSSLFQDTDFPFLNNFITLTKLIRVMSYLIRLRVFATGYHVNLNGGFTMTEWYKKMKSMTSPTKM